MKKENQYLKPILYTATAAMLLFGRHPMSWLLSSRLGKPVKRRPAKNKGLVKCPGGNVWYVEFDGREQGPVLVLIHGLNASGKQWPYQREYFKDQYRIMIVDLPGHGKTPLPTDFSISTLATDLNSILGYYHIKDAVIYGHSLGGTILMQHLLQYGTEGRIKAAVFHGSPYTNPLKSVQFSAFVQPLEKSVIAPFLKFAKRTRTFFNLLSWICYFNGLSTLAFRYLFFSGEQTAAQLLYTTGITPHADSGTVSDGLLELFKFDVSDELKNIKIPVLIIESRHDKLNAQDCARHIHQQVNGSMLRVVEGGHQAMIEHHEAVNHILKEFMSQF